jgi:competence protein ComEC
MIDTGGIMNMDMATETLIPFLRKQRIYHVDCLIASHGDYDHIGAKDSLMANFKVNRFVEDASEFPLKIGGLTFENYNVYQGSDENENSLVLRTEVLGKSWLFTGDAGKEVEQKIVRDFPDLDVDMLKVGHHGSSTSSTEEFLKLITPEMAIISCGRANKFKHPNDEVLARLEKLKIPYRRTDLEGTITYFG